MRKKVFLFPLLTGLLALAAPSLSDLTAQARTNPPAAGGKKESGSKDKEKPEEPKLPKETANLKMSDINVVQAIVGRQSITTIDIDNARDRYKGSRYIGADKRPIESRILDLLIARAIVDTIAEQESIRVPPAKIKSEIDKRMKALGLKDEAIFAKRLSRELKISYELWKRELAHEIKKEQLIQIRIQPEQPSDAEILRWYRANKTRVGQEVNVREIIFRPAKRSLKAEIQIEKDLNALRGQALRKRNFAALARDRRNLSAFRGQGGLTGWRNIADIARENIIYANHAFQLRTPGQISPVFKLRNGSYAIIQSVGVRFVPLERVYGLVKNMLFREKQQEAFGRWIQRQRDVIGVVINMPDYQSSR
jgi:putative peptidyl-prolyl cis-trans isomerase